MKNVIEQLILHFYFLLVHQILYVLPQTKRPGVWGLEMWVTNVMENLIICCMKQMKGNLCASLAFTLFTVQNLFWSWLKLMVWSSQDSSDAIVTKLDDLGFESKQGPQSFSSLKPPRLTYRPHQAFYALGTRGFTGDRVASMWGWWLTFI